MPEGQPYQWPEMKSLCHGKGTSQFPSVEALVIDGVGDLRDTSVRIIALAEEFPEPACTIRNPMLVRPRPAADGRRTDLDGTCPLGEHERFVCGHGISDRHVRLTDDIWLVERHQVLVAGGELIPIVAVGRLVGPEGGNEHERSWGAEGGGIPVVDPCDLAVGEDA